MYEKIAKWYKMFLWDEQQVRDAALKRVITSAQAEEIIAKGR